MTKQQAAFIRSFTAVALVLAAFPILLSGSERVSAAQLGLGLFFCGMIIPLYQLFRK